MDPDGLNDISIINQTANTNMSMNTTSLDFLNKLHSKQSIIATQSKGKAEEGQKPINLDHFDTQSNASYAFNEEEMADYEENI